MITRYLLLFVILSFSQRITSQVTAIPDSNFEQALIDQGIDSDGIINGQVLTADIEDITELIIVFEGISDLTGIEDFESLEVLDCSDNGISNLDLSGNLNLRELIAEFCFMETINLDQNTALEILDLEHNELSEINLSNNINLQILYVGNPSVDIALFNVFETLDLTNNVNLIDFRCKYCFELTDLDVTGLTNLEILDIGQSGLTELDTSSLTNLKQLTAGYESTDFENVLTPLASLDLSLNTLLETVHVPYTSISSLNLQNGNNALLTSFRAIQNDNLDCILVDDATAATNGDAPYGSWTVDAGVTYADDECTLSLDENKLAKIQLVQNPVLEVAGLAAYDTIEAVSVFDISGKQVRAFKSGFDVMDFSGLPSGVYFMKVKGETGEKVLRVLKR